MNMREIKFRVWDKEGKCLKYLEEWNFDFSHCSIEFPFDEETRYEDDKGDIKEDNLVLQQFTGLKDKNGKEIYEGDIVHLDKSDGGYVRWPVTWIERIASWYPLCEINNGACEIIGNIHENKELLK